MQQDIEKLCGHLWNRRVAPKHWTNLTPSEQAELVDLETQEEHARLSSLYAWLIHSGRASVGGFRPQSFLAMEIFSRDSIKRVVPKAYRHVAVAMQLHHAIPTFFEQLDFVQAQVETLAMIDARLQKAGRASKFARQQ